MDTNKSRSEYLREWRKAHHDRHLSHNAAYRERNKKKIKISSEAYREANREKMSAYAIVYNEANRQLVRQRNADWEKRNPGARNHYTAKRKAAKLRACPPWADLKAIRAIYERAAAMRSGGLAVEVDHIVPLQNKTVCGLHVPANLRIIPKMENRRKGNRLC